MSLDCGRNPDRLPFAESGPGGTMRKIERNTWWPQAIRLKDELSLRELSEKFGPTPGAFMAAFKRNGITRKPSPPGPRKPRATTATTPPPPPPLVPVWVLTLEGGIEIRVSGLRVMSMHAALQAVSDATTTAIGIRRG